MSATLMTPLDLRAHPPRSARETLLGFYFVPRTIDKLRAQLPGGHLGAYLNHDTGFSAFVVKRLGLDMAEFQAAVAQADDEAAVVAWLAARVDPAAAPALNAKLETFVVQRMSPDDQLLIRERHPVMRQRPELTKILDILEAEDQRAFGGRLRAGFRAEADAIIARAIEQENGIPGVVAAVTDRQATLYEHAAGRRALDGDEPMTPDTVMCLYSCTKALTGTLLMQLVEAGMVALEDPAKRYVPEIADIAVLDGFDAKGEPLLRAPKTAITIKQLLLHTAGFGYDFFNRELVRYGRTEHARGISGRPLPAFKYVLLFDPGTRWEYGASVDWAGMVVEAVRSAPLAAVMRAHLLEPLGMHDTGFRLSPAMASRRATIHQRDPAGMLQPKPQLGLPREGQVDVGGSGLFSTAGDYLKFIRMILSDGAAPDGRRVVSPQTIELMAANALGELKVRPLPGAMPQMTNAAEFFPGVSKSWGYTWMINDEPAPTGRPSGELGWAGLANLFYWIDRRNGIGGFWATQILPFIDAVSLPAYLAFETSVYAHLT